ncbi:enoyl-CoA hydratase-related protein, partial [Roseateles sp. GG27B]
MDFNDISYSDTNGVARITINREKVMNAFRADTVEEMVQAFRLADINPEVGVIVLAGAGER